MSKITPHLKEPAFDLIDQVSKLVYDNVWQNSGGLLPFADAVGIFRILLAELNAADTEGLLDSLPVSIQNSIVGRLVNIGKYLQQMSGGNNVVSGFTDEIDRLHMDIWQGGFRYRSDNLLAFESKNEMINSLSKELERVRGSEIEARNIIVSLSKVLADAQVSLEGLTRNQTGATALEQLISSIKAESTSHLTDIAKTSDDVKNQANLISDRASIVEAKVQSATVHEQRLQDFLARVDEYEKKLRESVHSADESMANTANDMHVFMEATRASIDEFTNTKTSEFDKFQVQLLKIEQDIQDKLSKATGITLFHAFEERQRQIKNHWIWIVVAGIFFTVAIALTAYYVRDVSTLNAAIYIKLGVGIPAVLIGAFCLQQYSRERRLKEEYAFKSSISLSLEAYRRLVSEAFQELVPDDKAKFAEFLTKSISIIFDSPTERVFGQRRQFGPADSKVISTALQQLKELKEIIQPK